MKKSLLLAAFLSLFAAQAYASVAELIQNVKQNNLPEVQKLLAKGEDVNATNEQGNTALHYAVALDNAEMVKTLLAHGADLKIENSKGWTPMRIAETKKLQNVEPVLREALQASAAATTAETAQNTISQAEIAQYKKLVERAKQEIVNARQERDSVNAKNKALEQEINRLRAETEKAKSAVANLKQDLATQSKLAAQTASTVSATAKSAVAPSSKQSSETAPKKAEPVKAQPSKIIPQINGGNEEVVYCLNYLGQGDNQSMVTAAKHFATASGISQTRYNKIADMSNKFFATSDTTALKKRSDQCGKIITPSDVSRQNRIIRSLNYAIGY